MLEHSEGSYGSVGTYFVKGYVIPAKSDIINWGTEQSTGRKIGIFSGRVQITLRGESNSSGTDNVFVCQLSTH